MTPKEADWQRWDGTGGLRRNETEDKGSSGMVMVVKKCSCGVEYDPLAWRDLPLVGYDVGETAPDAPAPFELRNCSACFSTLWLQASLDKLLHMLTKNGNTTMSPIDRSLVLTVLELLALERPDSAPQENADDAADLASDLSDRLSARMKMNVTTSELHPDPLVRRAAKARADAYRTALLDVDDVLTGPRQEAS